MNDQTDALQVTSYDGRALFSQTELEVHDAWGLLIVRGPQYARAGGLLHQMVARMDKHSALVCSREVLAEIGNCSVSTVRRSLAILKESNWIDIVQIGKGGVNAYLINSRVAWRSERKLLPNASFTATVIASAKDQDADALNYEDDTRIHLRQISTSGGQKLPGAKPATERVDQGTGEISFVERLREI